MGNAFFLEMFGMAKTVTMDTLNVMDPASFTTRFKTIIANYLSSEANQEMLKVESKIEKVPKVRNIFTAEGLNSDVRTIITKKDFSSKAKQMMVYNRKYGGGQNKA